MVTIWIILLLIVPWIPNEYRASDEEWNTLIDLSDALQLSDYKTEWQKPHFKSEVSWVRFMAIKYAKHPRLEELEHLPDSFSAQQHDNFLQEVIGACKDGRFAGEVDCGALLFAARFWQELKSAHDPFETIRARRESLKRVIDWKNKGGGCPYLESSWFRDYE